MRISNFPGKKARTQRGNVTDTAQPKAEPGFSYQCA
jgi:hypothetical protein